MERIAGTAMQLLPLKSAEDMAWCRKHFRSYGYQCHDAWLYGPLTVQMNCWFLSGPGANNLQAEASEALTELFTYPIPQRWSIAHLYQAIVNDEEHVKDIAHLTTLAGYVHWKTDR